MKRKETFGLLALIVVIASVGSALDLGAKFFAGEPEISEH